MQTFFHFHSFRNCLLDIDATPMYQSTAFLWGILPLSSAAFAYFLTAYILEFFLQANAITAGSLKLSVLPRRRKGQRGGGQMAATQSNRSAISFYQQVTTASWILLGPPGWINACLSAVLLPWLIPPSHDGVYPQLPFSKCMIHLIMLQIIGDFFLYWGHRVQHLSPFLWKHFHSKHHRIDTPTPVSTLYIDPIDATLQGGIPFVLASAVVRPHPYTFALYVFLRIAENVINHSGIDSCMLSMITLKFPCLGRCPIAHHDKHHLLYNYGPNAKNFAEIFWIWDWMFGTLCDFRYEDTK